MSKPNLSDRNLPEKVLPEKVLSQRLFTGAGTALLLAGFAGIVWVDLANDTLRAGYVTQTIAWFLVAFAGYLLLLPLQRTAAADDPWKWLLLVGLGLRLVLLLTEPTLSDDVYRYLWEGHLVTQGVSPYPFVIDSPLGDVYDIPARGLANNTGLASPYLPVAHVIFAGTAVVLPSEAWTMQVLMIGFELLAGWMILKMLRLANLPERRVLLYWLNPLVIIEIAHGAHIDALILGLGGVGLWLSLRAAFNQAGPSSTLIQLAGPLMVAAATLTRPLSLLFIPVLFWIWNWRQRILWAVAFLIPIAATGAVVGLGLDDDAGAGVFGSARAYSQTFRFNSGIYHWLERWISSQGLDDRGFNEPINLTRFIVGAIVVTLTLGVFFVARRRATSARSTMRLLALPMIVYVLFTPVLHPWYTLLLLALLPFLAPAEDEAVGRWITLAPWIALSALLIFSYLTYEDPLRFAEREWVRRVEWYPTLALVAVAGLWSLRRIYRAPQAAP